MPKPSTSTDTKLVIAGQPSTPLLAQLHEVGAKITVEQIAKSIEHLEATRATFTAEATATGLLLLAKKQTQKRGDWQRFCASVWEEMTNRKRVSDSVAARDNFTRSLRNYCFLGQHFLADLEQSNFQPDGEVPAQPVPLSPTDVLSLEVLPEGQASVVFATILRWVSGRSLRRMLIDFRRAENAADQEEADEAAQAAARKRKGKDDAPGQMHLLDDMLNPISQIDALFEDKTFVKHTDKEFWLGVAKKLKTQAERAQKIAEGMAS